MRRATRHRHRTLLHIMAHGGLRVLALHGWDIAARTDGVLLRLGGLAGSFSYAYTFSRWR
jgi:hypothetical protein